MYASTAAGATPLKKPAPGPAAQQSAHRAVAGGLTRPIAPLSDETTPAAQQVAAAPWLLQFIAGTINLMSKSMSCQRKSCSFLLMHHGLTNPDWHSTYSLLQFRIPPFL